METASVELSSLESDLYDLKYKPAICMSFIFFWKVELSTDVTAVDKSWLRRANLTRSFHPQGLTHVEQLEKKIQDFQKILNDLIQDGAETRIKLTNAILQREVALRERDLALARVTFLTSQLNAVHALSNVDND
jgi:hypothetical protein